MSKKVDIVLDAEGSNLMPLVDTIHVVVVKIIGKDNFRSCRTKEELLRIIDSGALNKVVTHNGFGFDFPAFRKVWGIPFHVSANGKEDTWNNQPVTFIDTFQLSSFLNPDRQGGHSVENLSAIVNGGETKKVEHHDWSVYTEAMLHRCRTDVIEQEKIYHYLLKEWENRSEP